MATRITKEMKSRHTRLLNDLANHFDPALNGHEFDQLKNSCRVHIQPLALKNSNNAIELLKNLERNNTISVGKYDELKKIIKEFDFTVLDVITEAEDDLTQLGLQAPGAASSPVQQPQSDSNPPSSRKTNLNVPGANTGELESQHPSPGNTDKPSAPKKKRDDEPDDYVYKTNGKTGLLVILNFTQKREGALEDERNLKGFFKDSLQWEVETRQDLKYDRLASVSAGITERLSDHETADKYHSLVVAVMSHGNEDGIFPHDHLEEVEEKRVYKFDTIFNFFKNDEIKAFAGKPKVFLVQACRGSQIQGEVIQDDHDPIDIGELPLPASVRISIPVDADILIMWATTPGFKAFRSVISGSHFLREVVHQFEQNYGTDHVEAMLMKVRHTFACTEKYRWKHVGTDKDGRKKTSVSVQMPCTWTTLTKMLYLK
ncbi:LOW QUALITY PROTEIN: caspase-3-like [Pecten maximus]|uniref:LOW QUALITY PROTEIN: caspase-3-like n=1 Tax=Pecten maximus TaxID=6579 RepID=UPI001458CBD8|nr:LOW QUALITY PROTEIN: caspase-3-like [Pecten maximus]